MNTSNQLRSAFRLMLWSSGLLLSVGLAIVLSGAAISPHAAGAIGHGHKRSVDAPGRRVENQPAAQARAEPPQPSLALRASLNIPQQPAQSGSTDQNLRQNRRWSLKSQQHTATPRPAPPHQARLDIPPSSFLLPPSSFPPSADSLAARVTFRTLRSAPRRNNDHSQVEAQFVRLQRRVDRLAQIQSDWQQPESFRQAETLQRATQLLQQIQQTNQLQNVERQLERLQAETSKSSNLQTQTRGELSAETTNSNPQRLIKRSVLKAEPASNAGERFSLQIQGEEIARVLEMLGQLADMNILVGKGVTGTVSANLQDVTIDQALTGIIRSLGFVLERDDQFVYVMTAADAKARKQLSRKLITKVYRLHYISVKDLQGIITPILTPAPIGKIAVTNPNEIGIAQNPDNAGGDQFSQHDAFVIHDYEEVIEEVDAIVAEMDVPPLQVVIEAMILSVALSDDLAFGVNFALLNGRANNLVVTGNGNILNNASGFPGDTSGLPNGNPDDTLLPQMAEFLANTAGLKYGFIQGNVSGFIQALENISDTNLIASPQLRVVNKQKAELIIGRRLGYRTRTFQDNQTIENVEFLDVGTRLIIRPFISPDGIIRMEVHPERSDGFIDINGLPQATTTEVTTNILCRDEETVVIGGLIDEQIIERVSRIPLLGSIPVVGNLFRSKNEEIVRNELIVLLTPRIVKHPEDAVEGQSAAIQSKLRAQHFKNKLSSVNRSNLSRMEQERALYYFERDDLTRAKRHAQRAVQHAKNNLEALRLLDEINQAARERNRNWLTMPLQTDHHPDTTRGSER